MSNTKKVANLISNDTVLTSMPDIDMSDYLPLSGGNLTGDLSVSNADIRVLSGNYIQTSTPENTISYSLKNSYIQGEGSHTYGDITTGSKGFYIISVVNSNTLQLSGDISQLEEYVGKKTITYGAKTIDVNWSIALSDAMDSYFSPISSIDIANGLVSFYDNFSEGICELSSKTISQLTSLIINNDDNALYCILYPDVGNVAIERFSSNHAEGGSTHAIGQYTHAEGRATFADSRYSHAEGGVTIAGGLASHAEGFGSKAIGNRSHAEGSETIATKYSAHAEGASTKALKSAAHAEGNQSEARGEAAHSEGYMSIAYQQGAHAEGGGDHRYGGYAYGIGSHAEGAMTSAYGEYSHAQGLSTFANGDYSHTEGYQTIALSSGAHAEGRETIASAYYAHAEGKATAAKHEASHAEGLSSNAADYGSHAEGAGAVDTTNNVGKVAVYLAGGIASGIGAHAEGCETSANGWYSHAEGYHSYAKGRGSHAEGGYNAPGNSKQFGGYAQGDASHAEGAFTSAIGVGSHAEGYATLANTNWSHSEGHSTSAYGIASYSGGIKAIASADYQFAWNGDSSNNYNINKAYSFCINPKTGINGFYIGEKNLSQILQETIDVNNITQNSLYGKNLFVVGDSFSINLNEYQEESIVTKPWCNLIAERNSMNLTRAAYNAQKMASSTYVDSETPNRVFAGSTSVWEHAYGSYENEIKSADYIIFQIGLNDGITNDSQIGTYASNSSDTLFGAWNIVLSAMYTWNNDVKIGVIIQDSWMNEIRSNVDYTKTYGVLNDVVRYWGIPFIDLKEDPKIQHMLGNRIGLNPFVKQMHDEAFNAKRINGNYSQHPNQRCQDLRSIIIENFMRSL